MSALSQQQIAEGRALFAKTKGLILAGPQGSGKTMLARLLGNGKGRMVEVTTHELLGRDGLKNVLISRASTLIVDGLEPEHLRGNSHIACLLKTLVTNTRMHAREPYALEATEVPTPQKIIVCVQGNQLPTGAITGRHFKVLLMRDQAPRIGNRILH